MAVSRCCSNRPSRIQRKQSGKGAAKPPFVSALACAPIATLKAPSRASWVPLGSLRNSSHALGFDWLLARFWILRYLLQNPRNVWLYSGRVRFLGFVATLVSLETKPCSIGSSSIGSSSAAYPAGGPSLFVPGGPAYPAGGPACGAGGINTGFCSFTSCSKVTRYRFDACPPSALARF